MDYRDIQKLKAFFSAFKDSGFKQDLKQIPVFTIIDGQRTPVEKSYCLLLLRKFPQFQGDKFKDDNAIIKYLSDPNNRKFLLGAFTQAQQIELTKVLAEKPAAVEVAGEQVAGGEATAEQQIPSGESAQTMGGVPGFPTDTSTVARRPSRIIYNVPKAPAEEAAREKIATANKSGYVTEAGDPSKLVTTDSRGVIKEAPPSKIFIADSKGKVVGEHSIPSSASQKFNFRSFKMPYSFTNAAKNFGSNAQIFAKKNLGRIGSSLGGIAGPGLTGAYKGLGKIGIGSLDAFGRLSNISGSRLGGVSKLKGLGTGKKVALAFSLFGLFFGFSLIAGIVNPSNTPTSEASPIPNGLSYTLPLKDPSVNPQDIRDQIKAAFPQAKLDYWDTIINTSKTAGINPALALALWIEETGASQTTVVRNGGAGIPTASGAVTLGHLGCAPKEDQTINESLNCLIKFINNNNFGNSDFARFMAKYSSGPPDNPFANNPDFPNNFKSWYSKLVPAGVGAIQIISSSGIVSCPLNGAATITLGSKDAGGHCTSQYQFQEAPCLNPDTTGRATAIDVVSADKAVFLPTLGGQSVEWTIDTTGAISDGGTYVGQDLAASASYKGKVYRIRFVHLDSTQLKTGNNYPSGTFVSYYRSAQNHVHITLQEGGVFKDADLYFNLCR